MKRIIIIFTLVLHIAICSSQTDFQVKEAPVSSLSPNAASIGIFGDIPVNYNTGIPNITVPLYDLKYGEVQIPISLNYHPGLVKPNQHPGWVGLGWELDAGGAITRKQNGLPDEAKNLPCLEKGILNYNNYYYLGHNKLNRPDWTTTDIFKSSSGLLQAVDFEPDEFSFNFLGYTGKFYLDHNGNWIVVSNDKTIKVVVSEIGSGIEEGKLASKSISDCLINAYNTLIDGSYEYRHNPDNWNVFAGSPPADLSENYFLKFTLTTGDGTRYEFGGIQATEFSMPYSSYNSGSFVYENQSTSLVANAWFLSKIIYTSGKTVTFKYDRSFPTCNIYYSFTLINNDTYTYAEKKTDWYAFHGLIIPPLGFSSENTGHYVYSSGIQYKGNLNFPVYLSEIAADNIKIEFNSSLSDELGIKSEYLKNPGKDILLSYTSINTVLNQSTESGYDWTKNIRWKKLDGFTIKIDDKPIEACAFIYKPSKDIRLRLDHLHVSSSTDHYDYWLYYNNVEALPDYLGDYTDHWGFYNGKSVFDPAQSTFYAAKEADGTKCNIGLLNKIEYPTGGYTTFEWQPNDYSKSVSVTRKDPPLAFTTFPVTGGARISKISNYKDGTTTSPETKSYYYVLNYDGDDPNTYQSSGFLNGIPEYTMVFNEKTANSTNDKFDFNYNIFSTSSSINYSYNSEGSHIGYSEVIEKKTDGYTKYTFTNFDKDINNVTHWDDLPSKTFNVDYSTIKYMPCFEKYNERGKMTSEEVYNASNKCVKKTIFQYTTDNNRFNNYIRSVYAGYFTGDIILISDGQQSDATAVFQYGAFYGYYTYNYDLVAKTVTIYDKNGQNPLTVSESYSYNSKDQVDSVSQTQSDGTTITTRYKYPSDYSADCSSNYNTCLANALTAYNNTRANGEVNCRSACNNGQNADCMAQCLNDDWNYVHAYETYEAAKTSCGNYSYYQYNYYYSVCDMISKNMLSSVLEKQTLVGKASNTYLTSGELNIYKYYNSDPNQIYLGETKLIRTTTPSLDITQRGFTTANSLYQSALVYDAYDAHGNLLQYHKANEDPVSYLWNSNDLPIAEVQNAGKDEIYFNSFEENLDANKSGSAHSGDYSYDVSPSVAFSQGKDMNFPKSKTGKYKFSAWVRTPGDYTNNGAVLVIAVTNNDVSSHPFVKYNGADAWFPAYISATSGSWQLFTVELDFDKVKSEAANASVNNYKVSAYLWNPSISDVFVDDMRFHPSDSRMITYTYKPLIGMTSKTDEKNFTTYYEYDSFGRLYRVRDQNKNILKQYEYHYRQ